MYEFNYDEKIDIFHNAAPKKPDRNRIKERVVTLNPPPDQDRPLKRRRKKLFEGPAIVKRHKSEWKKRFKEVQEKESPLIQSTYNLIDLQKHTERYRLSSKPFVEKK